MKRGFSLLEALIALAIAAMAFAAIFELQHQLVDGQRRYEAAIAKADVKKNALVLIEDINPDETPLSGAFSASIRSSATAATRPVLEALARRIGACR